MKDLYTRIPENGRWRELTPGFLLKLIGTAMMIVALSNKMHAQAALTTTQSSNSQTLAQLLAGPGVTISNYTLSCNANGSGTFNNNSSNLGIGGGVVLSSGRVQSIPQVATAFASTQFTASNDAQLSTLSGGSILDPCVLEFDIIPQGPLLKFNYVFASEEYPEWVCSQYNDVFGFFISGPKPGGGNYSVNNNIALIPGTNKPVAINTINPGTPGANAGGGTCNGTNQSLAYSSYFVNNLSPVNPSIVYDGMTQVLTASCAVIPCRTYHLKIAIADIGDRIYDSGVFLEAYSFSTNPVSLSATSQLNYAGFSSAYEGCVGGTFTVSLSQVQTVDVYVDLVISGTATNGTDYDSIPSTVMIPAGQTSVTIPLNPMVDGISESPETVTLSVVDPCTGTVSSNASITISDDVPASASATDTTLCSGQSTQLSATGGLSYSWGPTTGLSNASISNPIATPTSNTTYTASMTWGACTKTASVNLYVSTPTVSTSANPAGTVCNGGTVLITATPTGPTPYSYLWSNGASTPSITVATGSSYTVTITDAYGCTANATQAVSISNLSISGTATNVSCLGATNGAIDITVSGTNAPFTYDWGGGVTSQDRTNLTAGTYTVTSTNTVGCTVTASYTITAPASALTTSATNTSVSCNGGNNGSITLTVTGGVSPYTYAWTGGVTTKDRAGLTAGSYSVTVTDFNGCTATRTVTITQPTALTSSETHVNENCYGQSIGSIDLTVSGGIAPYSYAWSNGTAIQDLSSLAAGTYSVSVADSNSCVVNRSVIITQPNAIVATPTASNPTCNGSGNGSITLAVAGGTGAYSYLWSNAATTQNLSSLSSGTFTVTVTDTNSCTGTASATLTQPSALSATTSQTNVTCNGGNNGTITLTVSGGSTPYSYNWGGGITTQNRTSLTAGIYTVTITDNNACSLTASATITQPTALAVSNVSTNVSCNGGSNGTIDITVSGGVSPYTYNWGGGITTEDRVSLAGGSYTVTATDTRACTATSTITITQPSVLTFSQTHTNVTCNAGNNGSINITIGGGTSPYTYNWGGSVTTQNRINLTAGTYTVTSTDNKGCSISGSATITQPTAISIAPSVTDATCAPGNNGAIDITVSGGVSPYTFNWGGGVTSEDRTALFAGTYTVTVTDNSSCTSSRAISVSQIGIGMTLSAAATDPTCFGGSNGAIDITVTGGTPPLTYSWGGGVTTEDRTGLSAGNYSITVTDGLGCSAISGTALNEPTAISITINKTDVRCYGDSSGSILSSSIGGTGTYNYSWSNGAASQNLVNIPAGTYNLTVTDANTCSGTATGIVVGQPSTAVILSATTTNVSCFGFDNGSVNLLVSGGTAGYTFDWSNGSISQNLSNVVSGSYTVTVTDANNCSSSLTTTVSQPTPALAVSLATTDLTCNGVNIGTITTTVSGGTPSYNFNWNGGASTQNRSGLAAGTYNLTVTDNNGCSTTTSTTISQPSAISINLTSTNVTCSGMNNGTISTSVSGGAGGYSFSWNDAITSQNRSGLSAGTYTITVTDASSCSATASATITEPSPLTITINSGTSVCMTPTGTATAVTNGSGTPPYTYLWSNGATTKTVTGLPPGIISVIVTDASGACSIADSIVVGLSGNNADASFTVAGNYCGPGATLNFTHTGSTNSVTHDWSFGDGAGTSNFTNPSYTYPSAGNFTVTHIVARGFCTDTVTSPVTIFQKPILSSTKTNVTCNGAANGTIDLTATGTPVFTFNWGGGITTEDRSGLAPGTYTVTVTDPNTCSSTLSAAITQPSVLTVTNSNTNVSCNGGSNGAINLTVVGGTPVYTYNWGGGVTSQNRTGLTGGTYNVTVSDANSCTATSSISVYQPNAITISAAITNAACNNLNNGTITLTVTGGTGAYSYNWGGGITSQNRTSLAAGNYSVTVNDANACSSSSSATITQPATIATSLNTTNVSCFGGNNGSIITTNTTGGTSPYNFLWNDGNTNGNRSSLPAGTYTVTITDQNNCSLTASTIVSQPPTAVNVTVNSTSPVGCFGASTGNINITVSGGVPGYTYIWSDNSTLEDRTNMTGGTYYVRTTDQNGCTASTTAIINQPAAPLSIDTVVVTDVLCYGAATGSIVVSVSGGTTAYSYNWGGGITTQNRTNIPAGNYTVTVTDANACSDSASAVVAQPAAALAATTSVANVACYGNSTGVITLSVSGGTTAYAYNWGGGITTQNRTNLAAGNYAVTVTDANACSTSSSATVTQPAAALSATTSVTNVACYGNATGAITLSVSGGTTAYSYNWGGGITTQNRTNLAAGNYAVTVTDANACSTSSSATVTQPAAALSATTSVANVACYGNSTGSITLSVSGGTTAYSYNWGGGVTTQNRSYVVAGTYNVTVTDSRACTTAATATITQPAAALNATTSVTNVACYGNSTGAITLAVSGGTTAYSYNWGGGITTQNRTNIPAGNYSVTITDANSCSTSVSAAVTQPAAALSATTSVTNVACYGNSTGAITLSVSGGTTAYSYNWGGGVTTQNRSNVGAGTYNVTVTDSRACTTTATATVTQPAAALNAATTVTNVACYGNSTGAITLSVSGGTTAYSYNWGGGVTTQNRSNVVAGTYNVTVTDSRACTTTATATVTQPAAGLSAITSVTNVACYGNSTGAITLSVSGGTTAYSYNWGGGITTQNRTSIPAGNYSATVTDANSCSTSVSAAVTQPAAALSATTSVTNVACYGNSTGAITLSVSGGTTSYSYNWGGVTTQNRANLPAGNYAVTVTDANACSTSSSATVTQPAAALSATTSVTNVACFGNSTGSITLSVSGGTTAYSYNWGGGVTTQNRSNLAAGTYNVTVTDSKACTTTGTATITQPAAALSATTSVTSVACYGNSTGVITLSVSGGTTAYSYNWGGGVTTQNRTNIPAGNYAVTVTDANGCSTAKTALVTQPSSGLWASTSVTNVLCNGASTGAINLNVSGGTPGYSFNWAGGVTTQNRTSIPAGTYSVTVTDANSCTATSSATINQPPAFSVSLNTSNATCNGASDGRIDLMVSGATPGYTFAWSNSATTEDLNNIPAGNYSVTIRDANNCSATTSATITQPVSMSVSETHTAVSCNGGSNASISITINGGAAPYAFTWNDGVTTQNRTSLAAGTYQLLVNDNNSCAVTQPIVITQPTAVTVALTPSNVLCSGNSNGNITSAVSGGTPGYSFVWSTAATTSNLTNIPAGNYSVTVADANACSTTQSTSVSQPTPVTVSMTKVDVLCYGLSTGSADLTVSGGTPGYNYSWSSGAISQDISNVAAGNYAVTVLDANACSATAHFAIGQPQRIQTSIWEQATSCSNTTDGSVDLTVSGGVSPMSYLWSNGTTNEDPQGLSSGNYSVRITDNNGCTASASASITSPAPIGLVAIHTDQKCKDSQDAYIKLSITGGTPNFQYQWSNGSTAQNLFNLPVGSYGATVTDANGCSALLNAIAIVEPAQLDVSVTVTDVACAGENMGKIQALATGGTAPYQYHWNNQLTGSVLMNITEGSYSLTVTDAHTCDKSATAVVNTLPQLDVVGVPDTVPCATAKGNIDLTVNNGMPPFTYLWSNGATTQDLYNLNPGNYKVYVKDVNGCVFDTTFVITNTNMFTVHASGGGTVTLGDYAELHAMATGSNLASYTWNPTFGMNCSTCMDVTVQPGQSTLYTVVSIDTNGCVAQDTVTVDVIEDHTFWTPNAFTPNGDGNNDFFQVYGNLDGISKFNTMIFDRWGEKVYDTNDVNFKWDGMYKGDLLPPSVYVYVINAVFLDGHSDKIIKGSVTIVR